MTITGGTPDTRLPERGARDSTRTIAVVALVIGGVALLGQLVSGVVPLVAMGLFGLMGPGVEESGGYVSGGGEAHGVAVPAFSGEELAAESLARAVTADDPFLGRAMRCEGVPVVRPGVMVACRTLDQPSTFVVVELDGVGRGDLWWYAPESETPGGQFWPESS